MCVYVFVAGLSFFLSRELFYNTFSIIFPGKLVFIPSFLLQFSLHANKYLLLKLAERARNIFISPLMRIPL